MRVVDEMTGPDAKPISKILVCAILVAAYVLINYFLRIPLPGVSHVDLRPQIVLIFVAGYLYGPLYGFACGFAGNFCTDVLFGYGMTYLPSWTIGNGLVGALIGFFPFRKNPCLERIAQMAGLITMLILVNTVSLTYAAGMENLLDKHLPSAINFRYFYVPALLSNILGTIVLFPLILLALGRIQLNYPLKLSLSVYYLIVILLVASWLTLHSAYQYVPDLLAPSGMTVEQGNAFVDAFSYWSFLLVILLILSFAVSGLLSQTVIAPLKRLENAVWLVLKGDPASSQALRRLTGRRDEVGILSYTVQLLSEEYWETQERTRNELRKTLKFIDDRDSGTDILTIALVSFFGKAWLDGIEMEMPTGKAAQLSNLQAVTWVVAACGLRELAATYSDAKVKKSFSGLEDSIHWSVLTRKQRQALALVLDVKLLFKGRLKVMDIGGPLNRDTAFHLLERVNAFRRSSKNYVGYVTEPGIVSKMMEKWDRSAVTRNKKIEAVMNRAISRGVVAGYQIKSRQDLANFDVDLTIAYSHSDFQHIKQLVGLLMSESLQAKLQLEPKWSSFLFLDTWEKKESLHLETLGNGIQIAHMQEFDMVMEFTAQDERDRFGGMVEQYAKRQYERDQAVLFASFYQPLFKSNVCLNGYHRIADLLIQDETSVVQTYMKEADAPANLAWFKEELPDMEIVPTVIWVNDDFMQYLGEAPMR